MIQKSIIVSALQLFMFCAASAQISSRQVATASSAPQTSAYDSNANTIVYDKYQQAIGQEIYILPHTQAYLASHPGNAKGYPNFGKSTIAPGNMEDRVYKPVQNKNKYDFISDYDALAGKYFKIVDFIDHTDPQYHTAENGMFLKLEGKEKHETVYYYLGANKDGRGISGPFVYTGFFEKTKQGSLGVNMLAIEDVGYATDINTGKPVACPAGSAWVCSDVTVLELKNAAFMSIAYVFKDAAGHEIAVGVNIPKDGANLSLLSFKSARRVANEKKQAEDDQKAREEKQKKDEAERIETEKKDAAANAQKAKDRRAAMVKKYGESRGAKIADGKVEIGMTKQMCIDAWGQPSDVNRTTVASGVHEQWVYNSGSYLYFDNGTLTSIQN